MTALPTAAGDRRGRRVPTPARREGGFTYLGILIAVALLGVALSAVGTVWATTVQRDREAELMFVGRAYRDAIGSYYRHSPGIGRYPRELDELIEDTRSPKAQRHLRRLYADPMTGRADWDLIRDDAGYLIGVRSSSLKVPLKRANFDVAEAGFRDAQCYCDWHFTFVPGMGARAPQRALLPRSQAAPGDGASAAGRDTP